LNILYPPLSAGGTKILAGQPANLYPGYPPLSVEIMKFQQFQHEKKRHLAGQFPTTTVDGPAKSCTTDG